MSLAGEIARFYGQGKEEKNKDGWLTLCPVHGNSKTPALAVTDKGDGDVKVFCHAGCDFKEIKDRFRADGVLEKWKPGQPLPKIKKPEPKPAADEKKSFVWDIAVKDEPDHAIQYFQNRKIMFDDLPICFRWKSYKDKKTGDQVNMIVVAASKDGDKAVYAVQRLFIDTDDYTKTGAKMLGNCEGRGIWFDRKGSKREIIVGEGIETTLSAMQVTGKNGVAALSTAGMKGLVIPDETEIIYICSDSDPVREKAAASMAGQKAAYILAEKFTSSREGRQAFIISPDDTCFSENPSKLDFNDLLKDDPTGATIGTRFKKAVKFEDLEWSPGSHDEEEGGETLPWFAEALKNSSVSRFIDNEPPALEWVFKGTLLARTTGLLVGPGAAGKSTLALMMLIAVATGRDILPGIFTPTRAGKVLGVFAEDDETIIHHRIHTIVTHLFGHDPKALELLRQNMKVVTTVGHDVRFLYQSNRELQESTFFQEVFDSIKGVEDLRLIVLDPVSRYHGAEENDNNAGTFLVGLIERIAQNTGAAVIILHHVGKRAGSAVHGFDLDAAMHQDASRGASGLTNGVRWQCNLFGLPEKNAKTIIGVSSTEPGQYLALKVCKKNYGPPEPAFYLERSRGGILTPCEQKVREGDADLEETIKGLVLDAVLGNEENPKTKRVLIDGYHSTWKNTNSRITRPAIERVIASCLIQGDLHERSGKASTGRKITYLSRYPEMSGETDGELEQVFKENLNRSVGSARSVGVETSGEAKSPLLNTSKLIEKIEVEKEKCKTNDPHFVSPRNCDNLEVEKIPPLRGEAKAPPLHAGAMPSPQSVGDIDAEYF